MDKKNNIKCDDSWKEVFKCTPKEIKVIIWILVGIIFSTGAAYVRFKDLPNQVLMNTENIKNINLDFKLKIENLNKTTEDINNRSKNTEDKIIDIWKHLSLNKKK